MIPFAVTKIAFQLATANLYGAHRDEFYYLESGHHLAWGYVDNPPLVPFLYRAQEVLFGHSVTALAVVPALVGGLVVVIATVMTADFGGGRTAQALAAAVAWLGPLYLTTSHFLSTVSLDVVFWALASWMLVRLIRTGDTRLWLAIGVVCGIGLLNKDSMVFWAVAAGAGLLATPQRTWLRSGWLAAGLAAALVIVAPNLAWEASHHWATLEFLRHLRANNSSSDLTQFVPLQLGIVTVGGTVIWIVALRAVGGRGDWGRQRWLATGYLVAFVALFALAGKAYYLGSWYLPLVAVGAVVVERGRAVGGRRRLLALVVVSGLVSAPLFTPVLPASTVVAAGFDKANKDLGGMLGWPHLVGVIAAAVHGLPAADQRSAIIFTGNYSEAGAVDFFGRPLGLPQAISGHNSFWWWGYGHPPPGAVVLAVGLAPEFVRHYWSEVTQVATLGADGPPIDPQERGAGVFVCRNQTATWAALWPAAKHYD